MTETEYSVGFFDESGTHAGSKVLAVGGWVATIEEWESFEGRWKSALKAASVEVFHFADLDNSRGAYSGWSAWRRENLIKDLIAIICRHDLKGFCGLIEMPEYRDVIGGTGSVLEKKHSPYVVCQQYLIEMISKRISQPVLYCFEEQRELRSFARQNFWDTKEKFPEWAPKMAGIISCSKLKLPGLQAADLLTYETAKSHANRVHDPLRPTRKSLLALLRCKRDQMVGGYFDKNACLKLLEWNPPDPGS